MIKYSPRTDAFQCKIKKMIFLKGSKKYKIFMCLYLIEAIVQLIELKNS
jgi:hypothetical protein